MVRFILVFSILFILHSLAISNVAGENNDYIGTDTVRYLKNNIHAQIGPKDTKASYANWTDPGGGHLVIPVNTPITIDKYKRGLIFTTQDDGRKIYFEYQSKNMGMSENEYLELITSPAPVPIDGFSPIDRKGIQDGKAYEGMTKEGVRIALGYPAKHRTPSLQGNTWTYWRSRFSVMVVEFDDSGKVISIQ